MNIDLMSQMVVGALAQPGIPAQETTGSGEGFEDMLQQAGQKQESPKPEKSEKPAEKPTQQQKPATKPQQEDEKIPQQQYELAASLITAQPVQAPVMVEASAAQTPVVAVEVPQQVAAPVVEAEMPVVAETANTAAQTVQTAAPQAEQPMQMEEQPVIQQPVTETAAPEQQQPQQEFSADTGDAPRAMESEETVTDASAGVQETPVFEDNFAVPVKVAQPEQPVAPEADDAAGKIADQVEQAIANGESKVEIRLTPENLGQLTVQITRSGDGSLSIVLNTTTDKAAALLERHSTGLQNLLAGQNQVQVKVEIQANTEQHNQFLNPDGDNNHQQGHQQHHHQQQEPQQADDFVQQLRLGLLGLNQSETI